MKLRLKAVITYEYEPNLGDYPEGTSIEEALSIDLNNFADDPFMFVSSEDQVQFSGEIIDLNK